MCWEQIAQIRGLVPQAYLRFGKDSFHPFDAHPLQYALPLFTFALRLACFYREPNPMARKLAARMVERLAGSIAVWVNDGIVPEPEAAGALTLGRGLVRAAG